MLYKYRREWVEKGLKLLCRKTVSIMNSWVHWFSKSSTSQELGWLKFRLWVTCFKVGRSFSHSLTRQPGTTRGLLRMSKTLRVITADRVSDWPFCYIRSVRDGASIEGSSAIRKNCPCKQCLEHFLNYQWSGARLSSGRLVYSLLWKPSWSTGEMGRVESWMEISPGMRSFHFHDFFTEDRSKTIQTIRSETSQN